MGRIPGTAEDVSLRNIEARNSNAVAGVHVHRIDFEADQTVVVADGFRLMWQQKRWPNEMARIRVLEKAAGAVNLGETLLVSHQQKMAAPAIVQETRKFREASAAAIRQATGGAVR